MAGRAGHRDRRYGLWWIWLAAAFAVALGVVFVFPFLTSPQPEQVLQTPPTSITEANSTDNQSEQPDDGLNNQLIEDEADITRPQ
jgi:hypothetical protein